MCRGSEPLAFHLHQAPSETTPPDVDENSAANLPCPEVEPAKHE